MLMLQFDTWSLRNYFLLCPLCGLVTSSLTPELSSPEEYTLDLRAPSDTALALQTSCALGLSRSGPSLPVMCTLPVGRLAPGLPGLVVVARPNCVSLTLAGKV